MNDIDIKQHIFQTAGLGLAPYKFLAVTENLFTVPGCPGSTKPGSSCDFCGTAIRWEFHLESADAKRFKVGSDCICKADDKGLAIHVASHKTKMRRLAAEAKKQALYKVKTDLMNEILALLEAHKATFDALPHPYGYKDWVTGVPKTWHNYAFFMVRACGTPALLKLKAEALKILNPV